jgi:chromosome segregation ATPase
LKRDVEDAQKELRAAQIAKKEADQAQERHKRKAKDLHVKVQRQAAEIERLNDELDADTPQTGTVEALQRALAEQQDAHALQSATYQDSVVAKDQAGREQKQLLQEMNQMDADLEELETRIKKAEANLVKLEESRIQAVYAKNDKIARIDDAKQRLEALRTEHDEQVQVVEDYTSKAGEVSARVAVDAGETTESLDKRLAAMRREIERNVAA